MWLCWFRDDGDVVVIIRCMACFAALGVRILRRDLLDVLGGRAGGRTTAAMWIARA